MDLSPEGKGRVVLMTSVGTIVCIVFVIIVDSFNFPQLSPTQLLHSLVTDIVVPIALAVPLIWLFASKLRQLAIAHRELAEFAATDSLTRVMSRAAFSTLVEAFLEDASKRRADASGALLIVDADEFKSINDRFGHDNGDKALVSIADCIRGTLRAGEIVGRIGGEEFGVFLPTVNLPQAEMVAERIRRSVVECVFDPGGKREQLTVSVGGAAFRQPLSFDNLFREADQQLYAAKRAGRNRIAITAISPSASLAAA